MSSDQGRLKEIEFFRFTSLVPDAKARLINSKFEESKYNKSTVLFACSSQYGYFIAGTLEGFVFGQTENLRDAIDNANKGDEVEFTHFTEIKAGSVVNLTMSSNELQLFVGLEGGSFLIYDIYDIIHEKENVKPVSTYQFDNEINAILPNQKDIIAVCLEDVCHIFNLSTSSIMTSFDDVVTASWSPKDENQIVCGCNNGSVIIYDINGTEKESFPLPDNVKDVFIANEDETEGLYVSGILWVEQDEIFVIYSTSPESALIRHLAFIFDRMNATYLDEIPDSFEEVHPKCHFYFNLLHNFGPDVHSLLFILNSSSNDTILFGKSTDGEGWANWLPEEENAIPGMPLTEDQEETYPVGAAIDLSATKSLPPVDLSISDKLVPPMPILFFMTTDGMICAYHMYNKTLANDALKFQGMVAVKGLDAITKPAASAKPAAIANNTATTSTNTATTNNNESSTTQNNLFSGNKPPSGFSFSSAAKTINNPPSFGKSAGFGTSTFGSSGFGTSGFGTSGFGGTTASPSFGSTNFGSAVPSAVQTVSLASLAASSTTKKEPATATPSGFGASSASGTSGFGATNTSGFGSSTTSGFGASNANNSGFGASNANNSGFGASNANNSGFGASSSNNSGFGVSSPSNSGFGVSSPSNSGFGISGFGDSNAKSTTLGTSNNESTLSSNQNTSNGTNMFSSEGTSMFSSEGTKRTAFTNECKGFELGGFSKALQSDDSEASTTEDETSTTEDETPSNLQFANYEEKEIKSKTYERVAKHPSAKKMEDLYFDTLEQVEEMVALQNTLQDKIKFLSKTNTMMRYSECLDETDYQWRLGDMEAIHHILDDALISSTEELEEQLKNHELLEKTINRDDEVIDTFNKMLDIIDEEDKKEEKTLEKMAALANALAMKPIDLHTFNEALYKELKEKLDKLEPKLSKKPTSNPSLHALRQALRHIDASLTRATFVIDQLQKKTIDTKPNQLDHQRSQVLSDLFDTSNKAGFVQKTLAQ